VGNKFSHHTGESDAIVHVVPLFRMTTCPRFRQTYAQGWTRDSSLGWGWRDWARWRSARGGEKQLRHSRRRLTGKTILSAFQRVEARGAAAPGPGARRNRGAAALCLLLPAQAPVIYATNVSEATVRGNAVRQRS